MNPPLTAVSSRRHLQALGLAATVAAFWLAWSLQRDLRLEHAAIDEVAQELAALAPEQGEPSRLGRLKNQGAVLQRRAFEAPDLLPFYGSSELQKPIPDKAILFFKEYPTGFEVFPVGKAGSTSLILMQKLAATGSAVAGKKVAICVSPGWFFTQSIEGRYYEGNFSREQASALIFGSEISLPVKRDDAARMLDFPSTLANSPLLALGTQCLAARSAFSTLLYHGILPLGWLQNAIFDLQDHQEVGATLRGLLRRWEENMQRTPAKLDWPALITKASGAPLQPAEEELPWSVKEGDADTEFRQTMLASREWVDMSLLLRTLKDLGAQPLMLSMPIASRYFEAQGVKTETLALYHDRLEALAHANGARIVSFRDHDEDPAFLADRHDHLSAKGWMYFNRELDRFFHGDK